MSVQSTLDDLPGGDLVRKGILDLDHGEETIEALLVSIAYPRLSMLPLELPAPIGGPIPEHRLYALLAETEGNAAHSRYNALIRRIVSFARAASQCAS